MSRIPTFSAWLTTALFAAVAPAQQSPSHNGVVIKNAVVMTVTHGNIPNGSVYIKDGEIAAIGKVVKAPASATVVDAGGKYLTPGIVDSHSHIALDDDVNEATSPITPQMMMIDAFDYQDKAIYRALAGGVTTSLLLHGSANRSVAKPWSSSTSTDRTVMPCCLQARHGPSSSPAARTPNASMAAATSSLPRAWEISQFNARRWCRRRIWKLR
jgi:imidazolonepropionase-like amidohydrolase